jgi:hypothetical protein
MSVVELQIYWLNIELKSSPSCVTIVHKNRAGHDHRHWLMNVLCITSALLFTYLVIPPMKILSESIRSFYEGFISFYTSIFNEIKRL